MKSFGKPLRRLSLALLLALAITLAIPTAASAAAKQEIGLNAVGSATVSARPKAAVICPICGEKIGGVLISGTTYVPLRFLTSHFGATSFYTSATRTTTVQFGKMTVTVTDGAPYIEAFGRVFFSLSPNAILSDGRMYVPIRSLAAVFGLTVGWNAKTSSVTLSGKPTACAPASEVYDSDAVYWLSRIISAEAKGEPLLGQIAVGNVVLNRVLSADFPNTIWGVIFDRKWGIQFTPVANGTIYNAPTASAILAAKVCLEGFTLSGNALYFLEPTSSTSSWIPRTRSYLFTVGHHDFYR